MQTSKVPSCAESMTSVVVEPQESAPQAWNDAFRDTDITLLIVGNLSPPSAHKRISLAKPSGSLSVIVCYNAMAYCLQCQPSNLHPGNVRIQGTLNPVKPFPLPGTRALALMTILAQHLASALGPLNL